MARANARGGLLPSSGVVALDNAQLDERVGKVSRRKLEQVLMGIDVVLGR